MTRSLVIVAHGTVETTADLPAFVQEIRRGRPAPAELIRELTHRYDTVGGSPLLEHTRDQARALGDHMGMETRVAMRLSSPRLHDVLVDKGPDDEVILVPAAPFSVAVYEAAAHKELSLLAHPPQLRCVKPWGTAPELIAAYVEGILGAIGDKSDATHVILSAHSLPQVVIDRGDLYAQQFESTCRLVTEGLRSALAQKGLGPTRVDHCYQSQGAMEGEWLGPDLESTMRAAQKGGAERVIVSPIGFLTEHIETLYDLDVEAAKQAASWGLGWERVPALGSHPGLIAAMAGAVLHLGQGSFSAPGSSR